MPGSCRGRSSNLDGTSVNFVIVDFQRQASCLFVGGPRFPVEVHLSSLCKQNFDPMLKLKSVKHRLLCTRFTRGIDSVHSIVSHREASRPTDECSFLLKRSKLGGSKIEILLGWEAHAMSSA